MISIGLRRLVTTVTFLTVQTLVIEAILWWYGVVGTAV